jgi:heme exporter protein B
MRDAAATTPIEQRVAPDRGGLNAFAAFTLLVRRDLQLANRRRTEALLPVAFFLVAATLVPLGVGPEPQVLRQIAPGLIWICALLAAMLSLPALYAGDHADGTLEQMLLSPHPVVLLAAARALSHWMLAGWPLLVAAPVLAVLFGMSGAATATLLASLVLGTPVLSLLGSVGAALTLGLRNGGVLLLLLVLPLCIPVLVFGAGAVSAVDVGLSARPWLSLLGALLLLACVGAPPAAAAALRISTA